MKSKLQQRRFRNFFVAEFCSICTVLIVYAFVHIGIWSFLRRDVTPIVLQDTGDLSPPGADYEKIFWFIQISDIHISDEDSWFLEDFKDFLDHSLGLISPKFVILTGDVSDARTKYFVERRQQRSEWDQYRTALMSRGLYDPSFWFDMRGNHDTYNVPSYYSPENLFRNYSVSGSFRLFDTGEVANASTSLDCCAGPRLNVRLLDVMHKPWPPEEIAARSYSFVHNETFGSYHFVAFDASLYPGFGAPLNFFGYTPPEFVDAVDRRLSSGPRHNHTISFDHYPVRFISSAASSTTGCTLHNLYEKHNITLQLSGHYHTPHMYGRIHNSIELECPDMKYNRAFRVIAFDHDLFSFVDGKTPQKTVILVTNPKHATFLSDYEPLDLMRRSTHVRALVFSHHHIKHVQCQVDGGAWVAMRHSKPKAPQEAAAGDPLHRSSDQPNRAQHLYVSPWDPSTLAHGLHLLTVQVELKNGHVETYAQPFSVDGTMASLFWPMQMQLKLGRGLKALLNPVYALPAAAYADDVNPAVLVFFSLVSAFVLAVVLGMGVPKTICSRTQGARRPNWMHKALGLVRVTFCDPETYSLIDPADRTRAHAVTRWMHPMELRNAPGLISESTEIQHPEATPGKSSRIASILRWQAALFIARRSDVPWVFIWVVAYMFVGPLFAGPLSADEFGVAFAWGAFSRAGYVPAFFQLSLVGGLLICAVAPIHLFLILTSKTLVPPNTRRSVLFIIPNTLTFVYGAALVGVAGLALFVCGKYVIIPAWGVWSYLLSPGGFPLAVFLLSTVARRAAVMSGLVGRKSATKMNIRNSA